MNVPTLKVAELFYSIQGEGPTVGRPAIFLRLSGCNLCCGGPGGKFMREGRATWWCDTEAVWRGGVETPVQAVFEQIVRLLPPRGCPVSLVVTGGEPTMPVHRDGLMELFRLLRRLPDFLYTELETNGTGIDEAMENTQALLHRVFPADFYKQFQQINCSPKLANSGMKKEIRYVPEALRRLRDLDAYFKFVVSTEADIAEVETEFIGPLELSRHRVYLMPGVDSLADLPERTRFTCEAAKRLGVYASTRLHILAWDKTTGV